LKTVIDLLRLGEPEGGRMYRGGGVDHALSEAGWQQMHASVERRVENNQDDWSAIISSPMLRCKVFATQLAKERDLPIQVIENLREAGYGDWEGMAPEVVMDKFEADYWAFIADPVKNRPANSEPLEVFTPRINEVLESVFNQYQGQHVLLISHLAVSRAIISIILGTKLASQQLIDMPFAGMLRIIKDRKGLRLLLL